MTSSLQAKIGHLIHSTGGGRMSPRTVQMLHSISQRTLTDEQVVRLRERKAAGDTVRLLERVYGLSLTAIARICRGDSYKEVGGPRTRGRVRK